jgi:hypothetical protein
MFATLISLLVATASSLVETSSKPFLLLCEDQGLRLWVHAYSAQFCGGPPLFFISIKIYASAHISKLRLTLQGGSWMLARASIQINSLMFLSQLSLGAEKILSLLY